MRRIASTALVVMAFAIAGGQVHGRKRRPTTKARRRAAKYGINLQNVPRRFAAPIASAVAKRYGTKICFKHGTLVQVFHAGKYRRKGRPFPLTRLLLQIHLPGRKGAIRHSKWLAVLLREKAPARVLSARPIRRPTSRNLKGWGRISSSAWGRIGSGSWGRVSAKGWKRIGSGAWTRVSNGTWTRITSSGWARISSGSWGRVSSGTWGRITSGSWLRIANEKWLRLGRAAPPSGKKRPESWGGRGGTGSWGRTKSGSWGGRTGTGSWGRTKSGSWGGRTGDTIWGPVSDEAWNGI